MINARAEEIDIKPSFRKPIRTQRCLIPATGFYEWSFDSRLTRQVAQDKKTPYFIHLKSRDWFCFAGLYDIWKDGEGKEIKTYTIITTEPNTLIATIHNRMPVILKFEDQDKWVDNSFYSPSLLNLLKPYSESEMEAYPVSILINNPKNNTIDLLKPVNE
jgi:putative SOS response-associated peptidase YedK